MSSFIFITDAAYSLDFLPQEFPTSGTGDMRSPALILEYGNGIDACDFRFDHYTVRDGKYGLKGLPAVYAAKEEAQTLEIVMKDISGMAEVTLLYGVIPELDIITRSVLRGDASLRRDPGAGHHHKKRTDPQYCRRRDQSRKSDVRKP